MSVQLTAFKYSYSMPLSDELVMDMIVGWIGVMGWSALPTHWKVFYWQHGGWRHGKVGPRSPLP